MSIRFLDINGKSKLAFIYNANGYVPDTRKKRIKTIEDGRYAHRLEDVIDHDKSTSKPLVIMVHDFPNEGSMKGDKNLFGEFEHELSKMNFPTLRFDFRGCGKSDGLQQDFCIETAIEDLQSVIKWAKNKHQHDRVAIISSGLGCAITTLAYDTHIMSELVFLWPVFRPMQTPLNAINTLENRNFMAEHDYTPTGNHKIGSLLANELNQMDMIPFLSEIESITQIQQGTSDTYSSYEHINDMKKHLTTLKDFGVFEGGEHRLPDPGMRKQMIQNACFFLEKHADALPPSKINKIDKSKVIRNQT